jgi:aryl-phospho-beta-D-glucosidase BglC (GH1 family)
VPLNYRLFDTGPAREVYQEQGWALTDQLLDWCEKYHVYVVLDLHAAPGGQSGLGMADPGDAPERLWKSAACQDATVALWQSLATRYKSRSVIAGYDLLNEPAPNSGKELVKIYDRIITAIREFDSRHLIFIEGNKFASDFSMFTEPPCPNMVYSFHMYTWFGDDRAKQLAVYRKLSKEQNVPLWCGEFGENSYEMIGSTVKMFDAVDEIAGWSFWTWKRAPSASPGVAVVKIPADWDAVMKWIVYPYWYAKPSSETTKRGIEEFLDAISFSEQQVDARMLKALKPQAD